MTSAKIPLLVLAGLLLLSGNSGCRRSSGPARFPVEGTVHYQGQPIPCGEIRFTPDKDGGNIGPGAVAEIRNGRFKTTLRKGVIAGAHVVVITGYDGISPPDSNIPGALLFPPYTMKVEISKEKLFLALEVPFTDKVAPRKK